MPPGPPAGKFNLSTYTLHAPVGAELEIRKSRFVGFVIPVDDRSAAMTQVQSLRDAHRGAAHVCWALLAGGQSGMSDDGEPSGTAGRPMLEVLRHHDLDGVLAAVVRYYGGIKLGTGGLVRAYTDTIAAALKEARRIERVSFMQCAVELAYADEARVRRWLDQHGYALVDSRHGSTATLVIRLPDSELPAAREALRDLTQGRAQLT